MLRGGKKTLMKKLYLNSKSFLSENALTLLCVSNSKIYQVGSFRLALSHICRGWKINVMVLRGGKQKHSKKLYLNSKSFLSENPLTLLLCVSNSKICLATDRSPLRGT